MRSRHSRQRPADLGWRRGDDSPRRRHSVSESGTSTRPRKRELAMTLTGSTVSRCSCSLVREPPTSHVSTTSSLAAQTSRKNSVSSHAGLRLCHCTVVSCDWLPTRTRANGCVSRSCPCSASACATHHSWMLSPAQLRKTLPAVAADLPQQKQPGLPVKLRETACVGQWRAW